GPGRRWGPAGLTATLQAAGADAAAPLVKSLIWAAAGASATILLAWPLAWAARRPGPWRWIAAAAVALTLATPGPVAGMALVQAYHEYPTIYDGPLIVVLADVVRTLPYTVLVLWPALRVVPQEFLDGAALDGYGPWGQIRRVVLPLSRGALGAAWGVAFVLALGELPASNLVEPPSRTLLVTKLIWSLLHTGVDSRLAGVGLVLLGVIAVVGLTATWALGRLARHEEELAT
ncbi:MAG: ABC transporter permease subunit, partial [Isosphaeraceae bacterium]|nr:ABC transporter permease subunit [Isosphaeraceae bacterium]